ncbi:hypothetical protein FRC10_004056 [Ceratobasidium sp. 414]|nr:hypothetical protein FRC10_004056 [Ceratobasidium sp. 414]
MVAGTNQSTPAQPPEWTLSSILDNPDAFEAEVLDGNGDSVAENQEENKAADEGHCVECEGKTSTGRELASATARGLVDNIKPTAKANGENGTPEDQDQDMTDADDDGDADAPPPAIESYPRLLSPIEQNTYCCVSHFPNENYHVYSRPHTRVRVH